VRLHDMRAEYIPADMTLFSQHRGFEETNLVQWNINENILDGLPGHHQRITLQEGTRSSALTRLRLRLCVNALLQIFVLTDLPACTFTMSGIRHVLCNSLCMSVEYRMVHLGFREMLIDHDCISDCMR
jgi:hypothetical protein